MSFTLLIGNKNYSSWSMRAWLLLKFLDVPFNEVNVELFSDNFRDKITNLGGETGLVPVLKDGEFAIWDTCAIVEYLYEDYPQIWPQQKHLRARARSICAEMHSGFANVRQSLPVNIRARYRLTDLSAAVKADIARIEQIWCTCLSESKGPWLFGEFTAADIMYAPVATRFRTYGIEVSETARDYQNRILAHTLVKEWEAQALQEKTKIAQFEKDFEAFRIS